MLQGGEGTNTGSTYFLAAVTAQVELRDDRDRLMETAAHLDTLCSYASQSENMR